MIQISFDSMKINFEHQFMELFFTNVIEKTSFFFANAS